MEIHERLQQSEQSRRLAWQVLQEIRYVLEILGDQRIPYEGERKRFRAEGDFLVRTLVDVISHCRAHLGRLENEFADLERPVGERDLPREVLQAVRDLSRRQAGLGLSETELRERLDRLQELNILPEHRAEPRVNSDCEKGA
ncbi:MAG: hypothetical protein JO025_05075 [Verrucomicrobia bacterium]|nr:hypothetical protein [Verrucomicrobiota bacterium]